MYGNVNLTLALVCVPWFTGSCIGTLQWSPKQWEYKGALQWAGALRGLWPTLVLPFPWFHTGREPLLFSSWYSSFRLQANLAGLVTSYAGEWKHTGTRLHGGSGSLGSAGLLWAANREKGGAVAILCPPPIPPVPCEWPSSWKATVGSAVKAAYPDIEFPKTASLRYATHIKRRGPKLKIDRPFLAGKLSYRFALQGGFFFFNFPLKHQRGYY